MTGYTPGFSASVLSPPGRPWARVCLAGDIDLAAVDELASVIDKLAAAQRKVIYVDMADITFADSTLLNFYVLLGLRMPDAAVSACRATPMTRWIIEMTGIDKIVTLRADLPLLDVSSISAPARAHRVNTRPGSQGGTGSTAS